ncbi:MAG TPA: NAD(P)-binding domain-containing protein [Longimicrobium sp.]|nr:NAD(P)-binding domain-containing protein [Longimicrobium sp.]
MQIGIFGTGVVGQTLAAALSGKGHAVMIGTRDPAATLGRDTGNVFSATPFREWHAANPAVRLGTFGEAARFGEVLINATSGGGALPALQAAGADALGDRVMLDVANPLDFSRGMPPTLSVCNTDSLGEQLQRAFPRLRVVKTLNTTNVMVMVNPAAVAGGDHTMFVCGNDAGARASVARWLGEWFGWRDVIDLGDITAARGMEMILPIWLRLWGAVGNPMFNFKIAR